MRKVLVIGMLAAFWAGIQTASAQIYADLVLYNGKILTADSDNAESFRTVQAVAIYDSKLRAVGSNDEVLKFSGPNTKKMDLKGRTVIPGLQDVHRHISPRNLTTSIKGGGMTAAIEWTTKDEGLAQLRTIVLGKKPGEWIIMGVPVDFVAPQLLVRMEVTRADLDKVTPNNPLYIVWGATNNALVNTVSLNMLLKHYPNGIAGMYKDNQGNYNGYLEGVAANTFKTEFEPHPPVEMAAEYHKKRMDQMAAEGITTVSTWVTPYSISVYNYLDRKGEMTVRMGYSHEGYNDAPNPDLFLRRLGDLLGQGTDQLWFTGIAAVNIDGTVATAWGCIYKEYPRENKNFPAWLTQNWGPNGRCYLSDERYSDRELILAANRYNLRITGTHVGGDKATDQFLDVLEEANKESPVVPKRFGMDHCRFISQEQAERAMKLGVVVGCNPSYLMGGEKGEIGAIAAIYGNEFAGDNVTPFRRMIDVGLKPVTSEMFGGMFPSLRSLVTRKDGNGMVWGPQQRISRREALLTFTRWAARYVIREDKIGSLEVGKLADLTVVNGDFLTVPEDEIGKLKVLMTMLGGKPTFTEPNFAAEQGLPVVGYQGPQEFGAGFGGDSR